MTRISKRQQAINSLEEELTKDSGKKRKQDTRRKILLGAYLISKMRADPNLERKIMTELEQFLDKEIDRQLFGFN